MTIRWTGEKWSVFGIIGEEVFCHISLTKNREQILVKVFAPVSGCPYRFVHQIKIDIPSDFEDIDSLCRQTLANAKKWVESEEGREKITKIQKEGVR
jgi:hypothetical protein